MAKHDNRMPIQTALGYVEEARAASRDWRAKSWRDHEMYDGDQWTPEDRQRAVDAGIDPLTINRIFPAINLILGSQELNRANIIAKARTAKDGQIAEIMTEALAFVLDQNDGQYRIGQASGCGDPGIGWLYCGFNNDPRQERISSTPRLSGCSGTPSRRGWNRTNAVTPSSSAGWTSSTCNACIPSGKRRLGKRSPA
ncbi:MAG: hypothetical protein ACLSTO_11645 [Bilophila wadsworthia]